MTQDPFEAIAVGDEAELEHVITARDVDAFADLTGDDNPLHMDETYARTTLFRKRVVHGMLTASFISTMVGTRLPGKGALWYEQNLRFLNPVRIGERIAVRARVLHKSQSQRILSLETTVLGEDGRTVIEGEGKVKVLRPEDTQEKQMAQQMEKPDRGAVVVSGGSRGIGAAIALALAAQGHPVVLNYVRDQEGAEAVAASIEAAGGRALAWRCDVADPEGVRAMVQEAADRFGVLDGVVNNASGRVETVDFAGLEWGLFLRHLEVQLKGAVNLCQAALPHLLERPGIGAVVNVASVGADNVPPLRQMPYTVAKAALAQFTRCLAAEYGPKGLRVNSVSPGMTETDLIADFPDKAKLVAKMQTPLRRLADPADIAGAVAFLMSEKARHITGQNLRVCGGAVMA